MIEYEVSDGICVLRLNAPPLNTISLALLDELRAAIRRANRDDRARAVVITGGADHFSAGADINLFQEINSAEDADRTSQSFQDAFQQVEDSAKPVAAAVAGRVLGGSLELALACHYRLSTRETTFCMPEVRLGINPGGGGTQRLPRLVGLPRALEMMLTGESLGAEEALELGLVDAVCRPEALLDTARRVLRAAPAPPRKTSQCCERVQDARLNVAALDGATRRAETMRPEIVAPRNIIEAVRAGLDESFQAGLHAERRAFAECLDSLAAQNKIYLFFATRRMGKAAELVDVEPRPVSQVGVVGMGSMGTGIAQALITGGLRVVVCDQHGAALERGVDKIRRSLEKRVERGRLSRERLEAALGRMATTTDRAGLADADLVIESVFEDVSAKRGVLGDLEETCRRQTVIATNTSTISLDVLADGMRHPERLVGVHFFNPAQRMPLVEIIRREATPAEVVATAMAVARRIGKSPVLVNNREGFLVNRIFIPYLKEAFWLLEDGADARAIDAVMVAFGFSMGPLALSDMAGLDILVDTDDVLSRAFGRHGRISPIARRLVGRGHLGQKTGSGVYRYETPDHTPREHAATAQIIAEVRQEKGVAAREVPRDEITERLVLRMAGEAFCVLEEGVARRPGDVDAAMVLGTGFPDFRGGVIKYASDLGLDMVVGRLDNLAERLGERFSPCRLLRERKGT